MQDDLQEAYPRQRLLFYVSQDTDDEIVSTVRETLRDLSGKHVWLLEPPVFIDIVDEAQSDEGDLPVRTVGGALDILAVDGGKLSRGRDAATFADVDRFVQAVKVLSAKHSLEVEFELDGVYVGAIDNGEFDKSLTEGLLGEWRRHLDGK